jgi:hypothetical protein
VGARDRKEGVKRGRVRRSDIVLNEKRRVEVRLSIMVDGKIRKMIQDHPDLWSRSSGKDGNLTKVQDDARTTWAGPRSLRLDSDY